MSDYRRYRLPGATYFFTLVAYRRRRLFDDSADVQLLRDAVKWVRTEAPFEIVAAVILPDHLHFLWSLPVGDDGYAGRIGRIKLLFSKQYQARHPDVVNVSRSRTRHRECGIWQRRYWEHTIRDEGDLKRHLDYIHYNPVKHGLASCPHAWAHSSFSRWVDRGEYDARWACRCNGQSPALLDFGSLNDSAGEP